MKITRQNKTRLGQFAKPQSTLEIEMDEYNQTKVDSTVLVANSLHKFTFEIEMD